jgi:hypothetical protein
MAPFAAMIFMATIPACLAMQFDHPSGGTMNTCARTAPGFRERTGAGSHFRLDVGRCIGELRLRKWRQSPLFPA